MEERQIILTGIRAFTDELKARENSEGPLQPCTEEEFVLLLGGVSAFRRVPGIEGHPGFSELYHCPDEDSQRETRSHLQRLYGITDSDSLQKAMTGIFRADEDFRQFLTFWRDIPLFDEAELSPQGLQAFRASLDYAALFLEFVDSHGFLAWDCNEQISLLRAACACGLITEDDFWSTARPLAKRVSSYYHNWEEYGLSCLCGAVYFMFCENGRQEGDLENFFSLNLRLLRHLFADQGAWSNHQWFTYPGKQYHLPACEILPLLRNWNGPVGCIATDRITVDGCKVGYLYREEPSSNMPDSGWRFFAGDESEEYLDEASNSDVYSLNTICNCDRDILSLLDSPVGTAYLRDESGVFQREAHIPRE